MPASESNRTRKIFAPELMVCVAWNVLFLQLSSMLIFFQIFATFPRAFQVSNVSRNPSQLQYSSQLSGLCHVFSRTGHFRYAKRRHDLQLEVSRFMFWMLLFQTAKKHSHCPPKAMAYHSYSICQSRWQSNAVRGSVHRSHGLRREQNLNRIASNSAKPCDIIL